MFEATAGLLCVALSDKDDEGVLVKVTSLLVCGLIYKKLPIVLLDIQ